MGLNFKRAEKVRLDLSVQQQREIKSMYQQAAKGIAKELEKPLRVPSDAMRKEYLEDLQKQVNQALADVGKSTEQIIKNNAEKVAESVVGCNTDWLKSVGLPIGGAYSWVPQDVVTSVATGQIYEGPWSLSAAIWSDVQNQQKEIQTIIAQGITENKSAFDIAKDLEHYVDPSAAKPWDWSIVYPGVRRKIDYSAQRLARTMVSHAYQQSFVCTTQKNPFVTKYKWEASNSDRMCELCQDRDGQLFPKDDLPLDHPNGMCTFTAVIEDSMDQVADRLADWVNGAEDKELDAWAKDMYGNQWVKPMSETSAFIAVQGKDISETWQRREGQFDFAIEDVMNAQGFDGLPRVVSPEEFDKVVKESELYCQRVYGAETKDVLHSYQDALYQGKWYVDCSEGGAAFGRGMYCGCSYSATETEALARAMVNYAEAENNIVETFTLAGAKTISNQELSDLIRSRANGVLDKFGGDQGAFAASLGYDAITECGRRNYVVVLNRTKCVFQEGADIQDFKSIRQHWLDVRGRST